MERRKPLGKWLRRLFGRDRKKSKDRWSVSWGDVELLARPVGVGQARIAGTLRAVRVRTWAGCQMVPGESSRWPEILALELDEPKGVLAPLKWAPSDPEKRSAMLAEMAAWWPGRLEPRPDEQVRLLSIEDLADLPVSLGDRFEARGFFYPMFQTGTVVAFVVWGVCLLPQGGV